MGQERILVVCPDFYIESANTLIIDRICRFLAEHYTLNIVSFFQKDSQMLDKKELELIDIPFYSFKSQTNTAKLNVGDFFRLFFLSIKSKSSLSNLDDKNTFFYLRELEKKIDIHDYSLIISFSSPFLAHMIASKLSAKYGLPWLAIYFDPFFSNVTLKKRGLVERKKAEEAIMHNAAKIMMTYPTSSDYIGRNVSFKNKIIQMELPGIRDSLYSGYKGTRKKNKCFFIGNLYKDIRNPEKVIGVFGLLKNYADLYFVGAFYGDQIKVSDVPVNVHFCGKRTSREIEKIYNEADFLVNIGNSIINQMPSKIFEYISTGKPIINVYKKRNCPTLKYLKKYDLALNIYEGDIEKDAENVADTIKVFLAEKSGSLVDQSVIRNVYADNTDCNVAARIIEQMQLLLPQETSAKNSKG